VKIRELCWISIFSLGVASSTSCWASTYDIECRTPRNDVERIICQNPSVEIKHIDLIAAFDKRLRGSVGGPKIDRPELASSSDPTSIENDLTEWLNSRSDCLEANSMPLKVKCLRDRYGEKLYEMERPTGTLRSIKKGDSVYLQACGADPQYYFPEPFIRGNAIREVGNVVTNEAKSKYGRPFQVIAKSTIERNGQTYSAQLTDFRDLVVVDSRGQVIYKRKVSGASSLYEVSHQGKVYAWGVGWHKYCRENYDVDFTALRLLSPELKAGDISISELVGAFDFRAYEKINASSSTAVFEDRYAKGLCGACTWYYAFPRYVTFSKPVESIDELRKLGATEGFDDYYEWLSWLLSIRDYDQAIALVLNNGEKIAKHMDKGYPSASLSLDPQQTFYDWYEMHRSSIPKKDAGRSSEGYLSDLLEVSFGVCSRLSDPRAESLEGLYGSIYDEVLPVPRGGCQWMGNNFPRVSRADQDPTKGVSDGYSVLIGRHGNPTDAKVMLEQLKFGGGLDARIVEFRPKLEDSSDWWVVSGPLEESIAKAFVSKVRAIGINSSRLVPPSSVYK
jgi:hypothetical protein